MLTSSAFLDWLSPQIRTAPALKSVPHTGTRRLVIGQALGCSRAHVTPFVRSLRKVYGGDVVLLMDEDPDLRALLETFEIACVTLARWPDRGSEGAARLATLEQLIGAAAPDASILIVDVKRAVFQSDPLLLTTRRIELITERGDVPPGHGRSRSPMQGPQVASLIDCPALSSAAIAGEAAALARLYRMALVLAALTPRSGTDFDALGRAFHLGLTEAEAMPNYTRVARVGDSTADRPRIRAGRIVNPDGSVSPIVYNYARDAALSAYVQAKWSALPAPEEGPYPVQNRTKRASGRPVVRGWTPV